MTVDVDIMMRDDLIRAGSARLDCAQLVDMIRCDWRREVLDNGLVVLLHPDPSTPLVHLSIGYRVGSMDEGPKQTGLAHMFEHLMFGGTRQLPGSYITRMKDAGAIDINAMTGRDITRYFQTIPPHLLDFALFAEADRMGNFLESIDGAALERERKVVQAEKKQIESQTMGRLYLWLAEGMLAVGHPYRHPTIGYSQDIAGYTLDDVRAWYAMHYMPSNAVLVLSGGIDPDAALALVDRHFGHIPTGPRPARMTARVETVVRNSAMRVTDRIGAPGMFYQGWSTPSIVASPRESTALTLACQLLAGGRSSVLYRHLVEESGLATQVSGFHMAGQAAGTFIVDVSLKARADARIGAAISDATRAFADTPITEDRMALIRSNRLVTTVQSLVSFEKKAALLLEGEIMQEDADWFRKEAALVATIDEAEIRAATREWLGSGAFGLSVDPIPNYRSAVRTAPEMPSLGDPAAAVIRSPDWEEILLGNGARLRVARRPGDPAFHLRLSAVGGQAAEPEGKEGMAALLVSQPEVGVGGEDGPALADRLTRAHLSFSMGVALTSVQMNVSGLRGGLADAAALLADALTRPRFRTAAFDRYMESTKANAATARTTPQRRAMLASFSALLGEKHRLAAPAAVSPGLTVDDVEQFHTALFRPQNTILFLSGDVDPAEAAATLEAAMADWTAPPAPALSRRLDLEPVRPGIHLFEAAGQGSVQVALTWRARHLDEAEHLVHSCLGYLLCGGYTSRANLRLREELGWTYGVQGGAGRLAPRVGPDYGMIRTSVNEAHVGEALVELESMIEAMRGAAPATDTEIESFRRGERDRMARLNETPILAVETMDDMFYEGMTGTTSWLEYRDRLEALSEPLLAAQSGGLLPPPDDLVYTLSGDVATIRRSLAAVGLDSRIVEEPVAR